MKKNKTVKKKKRPFGWHKLMLELLVVFLGVTAGFVLNNWRIQQQEKKLEEKYLSGFLEDINKDIPELQNLVREDSQWIARATPLINALKKGHFSMDSAKVSIKMMLSIGKFESHTGTYENITNSGTLNIISDFKLRGNIVDYYLSIKGVEFVEKYFIDYFQEFIMPFMLTEYSMLEDDFIHPDILQTNRFSNLFAGYYSLLQQRHENYTALLEKSKILRREIMKVR